MGGNTAGTGGTAGRPANSQGGNSSTATGGAGGKASALDAGPVTVNGGAANGSACKVTGDCASRFCADGICCDVACNGPCVACNLPTMVGRCSPAGLGAVDPHSQCKDDGAESCARTGRCDGKGGCARYSAETTCRPGQCDGTNFIPPSTCDGQGSCLRSMAVACYPMGCAMASGCKLKCTADSECLNGKACVRGLCDIKKIGQPCESSVECGTGFCADGFCCDEACTGSCRSCGLSTSRGTCKVVAAGAKDPHSKCVAEAATSCGNDGLCTADGNCARHPQAPCAKRSAAQTGSPKKPAAATDAEPASPGLRLRVNRMFVAVIAATQVAPPDRPRATRASAARPDRAERNPRVRLARKPVNVARDFVAKVSAATRPAAAAARHVTYPTMLENAAWWLRVSQIQRRAAPIKEQLLAAMTANVTAKVRAANILPAPAVSHPAAPQAPNRIPQPRPATARVSVSQAAASPARPTAAMAPLAASSAAWMPIVCSPTSV